MSSYFRPDVSLTESWGYLTENGKFDGLVGALSEQSVDYGSSPLFVRTDRATVMEYGRRTWTLRAAFIFRIPETKNSIDVFIRPLSLSIWLLTIFSFILVVLLLRFAQLHEKRNMNRITDTTWSYFVLCAVGAFCQQGMTVTPSSYSGRIIIMSMLTLSIMIYQFYSASLVSHFLMKPETQIKSIEDILKSDMKVGCEDILYNRDYFLYTTDEASKKLYSRKILGQKNNSNFLEPRKGLVLVEDGGYAFHVELATAYPIIQNTFPDKSICELKEVQMYRTQPMHANYQKHSPFRDMLDTCLQHLAEFGILYRELSFWHPKKPECITSKTVTFNIGLDYFYPAFLFLGIGMMISLIILTLEIAMNFKSSRFENEVIPMLPFIK
nr:glutamate receptor 1-like [Leptinotarsa decemlineata]